MSIHTWRSFRVAESKGAAAAHNQETWAFLIGLSKRELAEIAMHLGALCTDTDSYDLALFDGAALARVKEEHRNLTLAGII